MGVLEQMESVRRLRLLPGDVIVVKSMVRLSEAQALEIVAALKEKFSGHEVMVLPPEFDLTVVGPDEEIV